MKKLRVTINGVSYDVDVEILEDDDDGAAYGFPKTTSVPTPPSTQGASPAPPTPRPAAPTPAATGGNTKEVTSPIAGTIIEVKAQVGNSVNQNDLLIIIEAMKMNTNINSPVSGKIKEVKVQTGDMVQQGHVLVTFE